MDALRLAPAVREALDGFSRLIRGRFGARVREVVLFGSHARGEAHEESDVDVLVVIDDLTRGEQNEIIDAACDVDAATDEPVGLATLVLSTEQVGRYRDTGRRIWRDIEREGVRL